MTFESILVLHGRQQMGGRKRLAQKVVLGGSGAITVPDISTMLSPG